MAADTETRTRADLMRQYVELEAFEVISTSISIEVTGNDWEGVVDDVIPKLFDEESDYEGTVDFKLAQAEVAALTGRVFAFLASENGREFCAAEAHSCCELAENLVRRLRNDERGCCVMAANETPNLEERVATLEAQTQALANHVGKQLYREVTHAEWDDRQGWLLISEPPIHPVRLA